MESVPRLITIPLSHYCEKARWALDRSGIEYREEPHIPFVHMFHTARVGCRSVPALVVESEAIPDSHTIVEWAAAHGTDRELYPEDPNNRARVSEIEHFADRELGPHVRRWAYSHLLDSPGLLLPCFRRGVIGLENHIAPLVTLTVRPLIRRAYRIDTGTGRASLARAAAALSRIGSWLEEGQRYLIGDRFTAADLTVASLAAPLLYPPEYGGTLPPMDALPAPMRADIERVRTERAATFILELYAQERRLRSAVPSQRI